MSTTTSTDLIPKQTVATIVDNVQEAKKEIRQGLEIIRAAKVRLQAVLGDSSYYHNILPSSGHRYGDSIFDERSEKEIDEHITKNAWRYIMSQTQLNGWMTERRQKELNAQIEEFRLPPLTVENILGTIQGLAHRVDELLLESVMEVYKWLRPEGGPRAELKTNQLWKVGYKAIVYGIEHNYGGGFRFCYSYETHFRGLGNVFSLLDGKGVLKYPDDFVSKFNEAAKDKRPGEPIETEYFRIKCYGNRNAHIEFKRRDLVDKLNKMANDGSELPGQERAA